VSERTGMTRREMLSKEKSLDAAIVATPDWMHAEHATGYLKAGLAVYCQKPMALTAADGRAMVEAPRQAVRAGEVRVPAGKRESRRQAPRPPGISDQTSYTQVARKDRDQTKRSQDTDPATILTATICGTC